jgi:hypothetical protein
VLRVAIKLVATGLPDGRNDFVGQPPLKPHGSFLPAGENKPVDPGLIDDIDLTTLRPTLNSSEGSLIVIQTSNSSTRISDFQRPTHILGDEPGLAIPLDNPDFVVFKGAGESGRLFGLTILRDVAILVDGGGLIDLDSQTRTSHWSAYKARMSLQVS